MRIFTSLLKVPEGASPKWVVKPTNSKQQVRMVMLHGRMPEGK
ncbi:hypothetical protein N752_17060 [Desulforamulus aquiferis]|nr:hypothetical protein N752_17060 [Desulforamulus aquiferis]